MDLVRNVTSQTTPASLLGVAVSAVTTAPSNATKAKAAATTDALTHAFVKYADRPLDAAALGNARPAFAPCCGRSRIPVGAAVEQRERKLLLGLLDRRLLLGHGGVGGDSRPPRADERPRRVRFGRRQRQPRLRRRRHGALHAGHGLSKRWHHSKQQRVHAHTALLLLLL